MSKNNNQPILIVIATLVSKRTDITNTPNAIQDSISYTTTTNYYTTFEVETGSRLEFQINSLEYGLLIEGDYGKLKFQGTRYLGFERL